MKLSDLLHQKRDYRDADGTKLPGVTTILGVLDKAQLVTWAAKLERAYVISALAAGTSPENLGSFAFLRARDSAAGLGTLTHARIEAWLQGVQLDPDGIPPDLWDKSCAGFDRFRAWWAENGLELVASEAARVDGFLKFGGTLDIVARTKGGDVWLVDIKTSNKTRTFPYPSMKAQVAAYERLWIPECGEAFDSVVIVRVGKDEADDLDVHYITPAERRAGWRAFLGAREAYLALKEL